MPGWALWFGAFLPNLSLNAETTDPSIFIPETRVQAAGSTQASTFYEVLLNDPGLLAKLIRFGITREKLQAGAAKVATEPAVHDSDGRPCRSAGAILVVTPGLSHQAHFADGRM